MANSFYIGGSMQAQHERTVEMLSDMKSEQSLAEMLWFLYDCQTELKDLKALAEIAQKERL